MNGFSLERYACLDSPVHRLDARVKLVMLAVFIACLIATPLGCWGPLTAYALLILSCIALSRVPPRVTLSRAALMVPLFGGVALVSLLCATRDEGWTTADLLLRCADLTGRLLLILLAGLALASTTPLWEISRGLRGLRIPGLVTTLFAFIARYAFLLAEQVHSLHRSLVSRGGPPKGTHLRLRILAHSSQWSHGAMTARFALCRRPAPPAAPALSPL